ncbi:T9SS type A sorting domain-containing protein [Brumimicrobium glaciale]|uniref:T9SS type A sorting domain-containing protein n=1 Tax=Brumimicrobium glaciale TaxID=200475 RepID=A0A4Q4KRP7_9FLAO|nr:T9SS type A sorting domain-containing protein [Brumimicrobium glaciale]RYM35983.1 T9SS type A sorting domain-containing protein [Brumimicrobium glaciale]
MKHTIAHFSNNKKGFDSESKRLFPANKNTILFFLSVVFTLSISFDNSFHAQACQNNINSNTYGNSQWLGHVYRHDGSGNPVNNPFADYRGSYYENSIVFDRIWGNSSPDCVNNDRFAVRYKMRVNVNCGLYKFTIGGDDGMRLSIDGGATWLFGIWSNHGYSTVTSQLVHLNGTVDLVLEYYENAGSARVSFDYAGQTGFITAGTTQLSSNSGAINSTINGLVTNGSVGTGFNYQWRYSDDNGSSWSDIAGQTSENLTTTAQGSVGTRLYRRETKCSGSVSYSVGASYTTVSPCASAVNMSCGTNYSATLGTSGVWNSYNGCSWTEPGGEKVYTYTPSNSGSYTFSANTTGGDPDFFLMSSCGPSGTNLNPGCWNDGNRTVNLVGGTTYYLIVDNYSGANPASFTVSVSCYVNPAWKSAWISMDTGSSNWCPGETRSISVRVRNIGSATWTNSSPDINIGVKWDNQSNAAAIKTNANGLASGAVQTYTFNVTAPLTQGTNRLTFDVVNEGNFWFADNNNGGGPGNVIYQSAPINIEQFGNPALFGDNFWYVYGYDGDNTDLSLNDYKGFYKQPDLGSGDYGVSTENFWSNGNSPSFAGDVINDGSLWNGCGDVIDDYFSFTHKRKGFPCGNYTFSMENWDDETRVIIDGVNIWSCGVWEGAVNSGSNYNTNASTYQCGATTTFTYPLDADSKVEFQTFEGNVLANLGVKITKNNPSSLTMASSASRTCRVKGNSFIYFYDTDSRLIAAINPNGDDLGDVTIKSFIGSPDVMEDCSIPANTSYHTAYMGRRWIMTSDVYTNGSDFNNNVTVQLPYTLTDLSALNSSAQNITLGNSMDGGNIDPARRDNLMLTKITGSTENGIANQADCASNIRAITSSTNGTQIESIPSTEYVVFNIGQFSEFFLHKNNEGSALPVKLTNFSASCDDIVSINWTTATEQNSDYFVLEKSRDGQTWTFFAEQNAAGNSNSRINYSSLDENSSNGIVYYRLKQVDFDGEEEIYGPISVLCDGDKSNMKIYPNPNNGTFTIEVSSGESYSDVQLLLTDITGKIVTSKKVDISNGTTQVLMNDLDLRKGSYLVWLKGTDVALKPIKVIVSQ